MRKIIHFMFFLICVFSLNGQESGLGLKFNMDSEIMREAYLSDLSLEISLGGTFSIFPWIELGTVWSEGLIENMATRFQYGGGLGLKMGETIVRSGWVSKRASLPYFYGYFQGVELDVITNFLDISVSNRTYWGWLNQPDTGIEQGFFNQLELERYIYWSYQNKIKYKGSINFIGLNPHNSLKSYGFVFSTPAGFWGKTLYVEPQIGYLGLIESQSPVSLAFDFSDLSRVPIARNLVAGSTYMGLESTLRIFLFEFLDIYFIKDLVLEFTADLGIYWPENGSFNDGLYSYSIGAGPGLNIMHGTTTTELIFGYNKDAGFGFRYTISASF